MTLIVVSEILIDFKVSRGISWKKPVLIAKFVLLLQLLSASFPQDQSFREFLISHSQSCWNLCQRERGVDLRARGRFLSFLARSDWHPTRWVYFRPDHRSMVR